MGQEECEEEHEKMIIEIGKTYSAVAKLNDGTEIENRGSYNEMLDWAEKMARTGAEVYLKREDKDEND